MNSEQEHDNDLDDDEDAGQRGIKNYVTPQGLQNLRDELDQLWRVERPKVVEIVSWAAGNGDRSENGDYLYGKKRLREIDRRVRFLRKRLESAELVDPSQQVNRDRVYFGATVTYADEHDVEKTVMIVGTDEADMEQGKVSWVSPIARALLKLTVGDIALIRTPNGIREVEIVTIEYPRAGEL